MIKVEAEAAREMARRAAREEGMLVGISSGATLAAIAQKLPELPAGSRVLGFNYDTGERYLSIEGSCRSDRGRARRLIPVNAPRPHRPRVAPLATPREGSMPLKDILVHLDATPRCAARLELAARLARQHDAHLIGLHVIDTVPPALARRWQRRRPCGRCSSSCGRMRSARRRRREAAFRDALQRNGIEGNGDWWKALRRRRWRCMPAMPT